MQLTLGTFLVFYGFTLKMREIDSHKNVWQKRPPFPVAICYTLSNLKSIFESSFRIIYVAVLGKNLFSKKYSCCTTFLLHFITCETDTSTNIFLSAIKTEEKLIQIDVHGSSFVGKRKIQDYRNKFGFLKKSRWCHMPIIGLYLPGWYYYNFWHHFGTTICLEIRGNFQ